MQDSPDRLYRNNLALQAPGTKSALSEHRSMPRCRNFVWRAFARMEKAWVPAGFVDKVTSSANPL
jgi:hypothetical protein